MINRSPSTQSIPLNIVGGSTFGRYPKISTEKTYNMFISDNFLVNYPGYQSVLSGLGLNGRGIFSSTILNKMIAVFDNNVYVINATYNKTLNPPYRFNAVLVGTLLTYTGDVTIAENNGNQIAISDGAAIYIYNPTSSGNQFITKNSTDLHFIPGYITFHDTYFIVAASHDTNYDPPANNTWRLSASNDGTHWPGDASHVGLLQTKPDNVVAVVRFPSRGNMILVFGKTVTEPWFDIAYQLFPYQRSNSFTIDYGCLNSATIAATDEIVVWLAANEKSGPVIMYTTGSEFKKITTDGIDYLFSNLIAPEDSEAFIFRQDGHLIYHINFYTDNFSLFYDFNTEKFFHACDENQQYFIAKDIAFFGNQYYFITKKNGNLYAFDTIYTDYDGAIIPRIRIPRNIRLPDQSYFIANDVGFTIEAGNTNDYHQTLNNQIYTTTPSVDLAISIDGGETYGNFMPYHLNPIGQRKNKLKWWNLGLANDLVCQFRFESAGRIVATDGMVTIRQ